MTDLSAVAAADERYVATLAALEDAYARGANALEIDRLEAELAAAEMAGREARVA